MQFTSVALVFLGLATSLVSSAPSFNAPWAPHRRQEGSGYYGSANPTGEYPAPTGYPCPSNGGYPAPTGTSGYPAPTGTSGYPAPTGTGGYASPTDTYNEAMKFKRFNFGY